MKDDGLQALRDVFKGVKVTFSKNCRSGLLAVCQCWRCRKSRNEPVTEESEKLAAEQAEIADVVERERRRKWFKDHYADARSGTVVTENGE